MLLWSGQPVSELGSAVTTMAISIEIIFLVRVLHVRPAYTGVLVAVASLGGVAAGVASGRLSPAPGSGPTPGGPPDPGRRDPGRPGAARPAIQEP
jgi:hypothetical protein